jgi:DNA modification methylase
VSIVPNTLYYGDNLDILRRYIANESIDLVYLDPPFNSNATYNVLFAEQDGSRAAAQVEVFTDTWRWDQAAVAAYEETVAHGGSVADALRAMRTLLGGSNLLAYLSMMAPRLVELRRVLRPTGSLYLHCDPTASHYLKLLLDAVFGSQNFRSEIIWRRTHAHSGGNRFGPVHDTIFYYGASPAHECRPERIPYTEDYVQEFFKTDQEGRRYQSVTLTGSGTRSGDSGKPWRGIDPTKVGRHWAIPGFLRPMLDKPAPATVQEALDRLDDIGRILWPKKASGAPRLKQYVDDMSGVEVQDVWNDIPPIGAHAAERLGYPTQKPFALLKRIIQSSSNSGDVVLDPFCGCGTAVDAAQRLEREWIGIDITHLAVNLIRHRMKDAYGDAAKFAVIGEPTDTASAADLAASDPYQFQWWALGLVGARPVEQKKGADRGIDGRLYFHEQTGGETKQIVFSVKAGQVHRNHVHELRGVMEREHAAIGVLLSMEPPTHPMREEAAEAGSYVDAWGQRYPRLQLFTVGELLAGKKIEMPMFARNTTVAQAQDARPALGT